MEALKMRSRSARFLSCANTGWPVVFCIVMIHLPFSFRLSAACAAAPICSSERPSRSETLSTTTAAALVALSRFCWKWVVREEISSFIFRSLALSASESGAPARTNWVW